MALQEKSVVIIFFPPVKPYFEKIENQNIENFQMITSPKKKSQFVSQFYTFKNLDLRKIRFNHFFPLVQPYFQN